MATADRSAASSYPVSPCWPWLVLCAYFAGKAWFGIACAILAGCGLALALAQAPGGGFGLLAGWSMRVCCSFPSEPAWFCGLWNKIDRLAVRNRLGTDVFAYFGGRLIGGAKLWPVVSPSKTWSGTLAGVFAGALIGVAVGAMALAVRAGPAALFALGLAAAAVSQGGDMFESWIKRRFGVKDSSGLIPGHGGSWTGSMDLSQPPFSPPFLEPRAGLIRSPQDCSIGFRMDCILSGCQNNTFWLTHSLILRA